MTPDLPRRRRPVTAIVVFRGELEFPWFSLLKPGFRHCFILCRIASGWIMVDPLCGHLMIKLLPSYSVAEMIRFYTAKGAVPIPVTTSMSRSARRNRSCLNLLRPMTCVAVVKNILHLRRRFVWTPWQLFLSLTHSGAPRHSSPTPMPKEGFKIFSEETLPSVCSPLDSEAR